MLTRATALPRHRPRQRLVGECVPFVDFVIPVCGEEVDVAVDTAYAACVMNYPAGKYRVIVSDDGADQILQKKIMMLQEKFPQLHYFSRTIGPGAHHGFKSGNIDAAMSFTSGLKGGAGEYCAVVDVDMMPEPDMLRALLAPVINDANVGMSITSQAWFSGSLGAQCER